MAHIAKNVSTIKGWLRRGEATPVGASVTFLSVHVPATPVNQHTIEFVGNASAASRSPTLNGRRQRISNDTWHAAVAIALRRTRSGR